MTDTTHTGKQARIQYGPYGWLIKPIGLAEDHWRLADSPSNHPADEVSVPLFAEEEQSLGVVPTPTAPQETSPAADPVEGAPEWHLANLLRFICPNPANLRGLRDDDSLHIECRFRVGDIVASHRVLAECFGSDGKEEDRWIEDMANACPCCHGSGHKDDVNAPTAAQEADEVDMLSIFRRGQLSAFAIAALTIRQMGASAATYTPDEIASLIERASSKLAATPATDEASE